MCFDGSSFFFTAPVTSQPGALQLGVFSHHADVVLRTVQPRKLAGPVVCRAIGKSICAAVAGDRRTNAPC